VATDIVQLVKVIDGINRCRFTEDQDLLTALKSVSRVVVPPRGSRLDDAA
jgi:hypothetical protein